MKLELTKEHLTLRQVISGVANRTLNTKKNQMHRKVSAAYWKIVWEQVFAGYVVTLPNGFGTIGIYKRPLEVRRRSYKRKFYKKGCKPIILDPQINHRYGHFYSILLFAPQLIQRRYVFEATQILRYRLYEILTNTFQEFRSIEEYDKQVSQYKASHPECFRRYRI